MANVFYDTAKKEIFNQELNVVTDGAIRMMLISNATVYTPTNDDDVVDAAGANDPVDAETNVTGYVRGHGGAGRKLPTTRVIAVDKPNNRAEFDFDDIAYGALGNGANETIVASILIKEGGVDDTTSRLIAYFDFADFTTNGASFTLQVDAEGAIHLTSMFGGLQLLRRSLQKAWSFFSEHLTVPQVYFLRRLGVRPRIYRSIKPAIVNGAVKN